MSKKFFVKVLLISVFIPVLVFAQPTALSDPGLTPDSPFYFLKTWKEQIQLFFTFDAEKKAKQYLHLAEVRLAEYQKMIEKGKEEIAERTLKKYENQLNRALQKAEELKAKSKEKAKKVSLKIEETASKHIQVLQDNLAKVPEAAKQGLERAIEASRKRIEKVRGVIGEKKEEKLKSEVDTSGWQTYRNEQYRFEMKYPPAWKLDDNSRLGGGIRETGETQFAVTSPDFGLMGLGSGKVFTFRVKPTSFKSNSEFMNWRNRVSEGFDLGTTEEMNLPGGEKSVLWGITPAFIYIVKPPYLFEFDDYRKDAEFTDIMSTFKFIP